MEQVCHPIHICKFLKASFWPVVQMGHWPNSAVLSCILINCSFSCYQLYIVAPIWDFTQEVNLVLPPQFFRRQQKTQSTIMKYRCCLPRLRKPSFSFLKIRLGKTSIYLAGSKTRVLSLFLFFYISIIFCLYIQCVFFYRLLSADSVIYQLSDENYHFLNVGLEKSVSCSTY